MKEFFSSITRPLEISDTNFQAISLVGSLIFQAASSILPSSWRFFLRDQLEFALPAFVLFSD